MFKGEAFVPYFIFMIFVCVLLLLFLLRRILNVQTVEDAILIGNGQTIGNREEQDDYFSTVTVKGNTLAVVADGISGLANGRMASTVAVTTFIREFMKLERFWKISDFFTRVSQLSNSEILRNLNGARGGTTLAAAVISDDYLYWGAVGDSIIALYRNGDLVNVNEKHILGSVLEEQYLSGQITKEQALENPMRKRLINYLGYEGFKNMEIGEPILLQPGDRVVLCTDGVYNSLTELELCTLLEEPISPHEAAEEIIASIEGKRLKHQDNATIIIMEKSW